MTCCTADQAAQYITSSFIGRHDSIRNHKRCGTDVVCDQTNGNIVLLIDMIRMFCDLGNLFAECTYGIYIKNRIYILNSNSQTLQTHTGIDVLMFEFCVISVSIVVKLCKYIIPDFHITVTFAAYGTSRLTTAVFLAAVIINLRTWSARTRAMLPEIVFFSKTENSVCRNANLLIPDLKSLVIVQVYRWIQTVFIQTNYLCQKFPCPVDCLTLEVITKRKVSKHLKKGTVTCRLSYIFDITGTNTFLAGCHSCFRRNLSACKIRFQRCHTGIDQQQTLIIMWN